MRDFFSFQYKQKAETKKKSADKENKRKIHWKKKSMRDIQRRKKNIYIHITQKNR